MPRSEHYAGVVSGIPEAPFISPLMFELFCLHLKRLLGFFLITNAGYQGVIGGDGITAMQLQMERERPADLLGSASADTFPNVEVDLEAY